MSDMLTLARNLAGIEEAFAFDPDAPEEGGGRRVKTIRCKTQDELAAAIEAMGEYDSAASAASIVERQLDILEEISKRRPDWRLDYWLGTAQRALREIKRGVENAREEEAEVSRD